MKNTRLRKRHKVTVCMYCEEVFTELNNKTLEHKIPLSKGGKNTIENTGIACNRCNGLRGNLTMREFSRECRKKAEKLEKEAAFYRKLTNKSLIYSHNEADK